VVPQYEVAGKRIDLVVEDRERRLAVECDGDKWHGPDQYEADDARQRMLERCKWKFIRIRGHVFYANQSKALRELIDAIRAHGIEPHTVTDDETVSRDWVEEVSGNECMKALGASTVDTAEENTVQQGKLFPEETEAAEPLTQPMAWSSPPTAKPVPHQLALPEKPREAPAPTSASKPTATSVTVEERKAVFVVFDKYGDALVEWRFESQNLRPPRLHEVLRLLAQEGAVNRVEAADAVRYSRA
jgi:hypothetical protein